MTKSYFRQYITTDPDIVRDDPLHPAAGQGTSLTIRRQGIIRERHNRKESVCKVSIYLKQETRRFLYFKTLADFRNFSSIVRAVFILSELASL